MHEQQESEIKTTIISVHNNKKNTHKKKSKRAYFRGVLGMRPVPIFEVHVDGS